MKLSEIQLQWYDVVFFVALGPVCNFIFKFTDQQDNHWMWGLVGMAGYGYILCMKNRKQPRSDSGTEDQ